MLHSSLPQRGKLARWQLACTCVQCYCAIDTPVLVLKLRAQAGRPRLIPGQVMPSQTTFVERLASAYPHTHYVLV
jgi:hypothetical protein